MIKSVQENYGDRVRVRVCGLCWKGDALLLVNHKGLYGHDFWAPPGGGMAFGDTAEATLVKEFREETGLEVAVDGFSFACEFIHPPLHAVELFFALHTTGGKLTTGFDPEMNPGEQIIQEVRYLSQEELDLMPAEHLHGLFKQAKTTEKIRCLKGYWRI